MDVACQSVSESLEVNRDAYLHAILGDRDIHEDTTELNEEFHFVKCLRQVRVNTEDFLRSIHSRILQEMISDFKQI